MSYRKSVVISMGDPAGCGPQITFAAIRSLAERKIDFWVVGDRYVAERFSDYRKLKKRIIFIDTKTKGIAKIKKGVISKLGGQASLSYLEKALEVIKEKKIKSLVTAPVSKEAIGLILPKFSGHTEFLAEKLKTKKIAMMMASPKLKVVLLTRHHLLKKVSLLVRKKTVLDTLSLTYSFLEGKMQVKKPKIALAAFNPHAGVNTFMGPEEKIMLKAASEFYGRVYGPYPSDSLFREFALKKFDAIVAAYHDQAMIPFKLLSLHRGINITLGLPIVRTSPDHGVAFDLAKEKPDLIFSTSMRAAILTAVRLSS